MKDKLKEELPGILNWALEGLSDWMKHNLIPPKQVKTATSEYRADNDVLYEFIESCCDIYKSSKTRSSDLHSMYEYWALSNGEKSLSNRVLTRLMVERGYEKRHTDKGTVICGIKLKNEKKPENEKEF